MTESNLNLSQGSDDMPFSAQNIEQALDILSAEAGNLSDAQYQETALANVNLLRDVMRQSGVTPMSMSTSMKGTLKTDSNASALGGTAERAMGVAKQVQDLGFAEFTGSLINYTFDAIIGATIKQMKAYAELVADIAKTLTQFQAENISDAQVNAHLSNRYPDGQGGTSIRSDYTFQATAANLANGVTGSTASEKMQAVVEALILETAVLKTPAVPLTRTNLAIEGAATAFTTNQIALIRQAIGQTLASNMLEALRAMAREGMARIVITDGEIFARLTFQVNSTEAQSTQKAKYNSESFGAYIQGSAGWGWGSVSAGASYSNLSVNMVNESSFDSLTMSAEMVGSVNLKFKSETFPAITI